MKWHLCSKKTFSLLSKLFYEEESVFFHISCELFDGNRLLFPHSEIATLFYLSEEDLLSSKEPQKVQAILLCEASGEIYLCGRSIVSEEDFLALYSLVETYSPYWHTFFSTPQLSAKNESLLKNSTMPIPWDFETHLYYFMSYHLPLAKQKPKQSLSSQALPFSISFSHRDAKEQLKTLHAHYLLAEVSTPQRPISFDKGKKISLTLLKNQLIAGAYEEKRLIGKVNTNLKGIRTVQLGGIFTLPEARRKGVALALLRAIIKRLQHYFDSITLFVRQENLVAQKLYQKAGFHINKTLGIYYKGN